MAQTRTLLAIACLVLAASSSLARPLPAALVEDPPVFPLAEVARGQRGYGYTVFASADGPERFEFVVLGVMRGYLGPGEDLIIARLEGAKIEHTGVISGMSGSPVFIDGRLVGAVGYRFGAFTKEPIAGITPIERMMTVADAPPARAASSTTVPSALQTTAFGAAEPIAVPLVVSGLHPVVAAHFEPALLRRGYGPLVAGGSTSAAAARAASSPSPTASAGERLYPAGPIAGLLVAGDIDMAAIGTVTWVKGDRFLAFGHPFRGSGASEMPVASAEIVTTVASAAGSFKLGQASGVVGRLTDDRVHAIGGTQGERPRTVPVDLRLRVSGPRAGRDEKTTLHFEVIRDREDTPLFTAISLANALTNRVSLEEGGSVSVVGKARYSTGDVVDIVIREAIEGSSGVFVMAALQLLGTLSALVEQDFAEVFLESVDLDVEVRTDVVASRVVGVDVVKTLVPGERGAVRVRVRPYRGPARERVVDVTLPASVPPGNYLLVVGDARAAHRTEVETGLVPQPQRLADVARNLRARPASNTLSLYLVADDMAVRLDGQNLSGLPASMVGLLSEGGGTSGQVLDERALRIGRVSLDELVVGEARGKIEIPAPESR